VTTENLGDLENAASASRPGTSHIPEYADFIRVSHDIRELQITGAIDITPGTFQNVPSMEITLDRQYKNDPKLKEVLRLLGIKKWDTQIHVVAPTTILTLEPRSFISVLYYLSKSVEVTEEDVKSGIVVIPKLPDGQYFDWNEITSGMMKIHSSRSYPQNATVAVYYRGRWFFIADNDVNSKETLAMIEQLFSLQAGQVSGTPPVLTLNVPR